MRGVNTLWSGLLILAAVGCTPESPEAPTVAHYRTHPEERRLMVRACMNDPAKARGRADCTNALEADALESLGSLRELPPLDLPVPSTPSPSAAVH